MALFTTLEFNSLEDLLVEQLKDLYDLENRLTEALPKMAEAATSSSLKQAFLDHLQETRNHVTRLEQGFNRLDKLAELQTFQAMKGLLAEGSEVIAARATN
jgi:ferritin-like metal-binding protein YciE